MILIIYSSESNLIDQNFYAESPTDQYNGNVSAPSVNKNISNAEYAEIKSELAQVIIHYFFCMSIPQLIGFESTILLNVYLWNARKATYGLSSPCHPLIPRKTKISTYNLWMSMPSCIVSSIYFFYFFSLILNRIIILHNFFCTLGFGGA